MSRAKEDIWPLMRRDFNRAADRRREPREPVFDIVLRNDRRSLTSRSEAAERKVDWMN